MSTIVLEGIPGSGKTTLARWLSDHLGLPLYCEDIFAPEVFALWRAWRDDDAELFLLHWEVKAQVERLVGVDGVWDRNHMSALAYNYAKADMPGVIHVHVPRGMGLQHTPDSLDRLQYERQAFHHADSQNTWIAAISSYMREHLRTDYGVPDEKLIPIHCGVLLDEHKPVPQAEIDRILRDIGLGQGERFFLSFGRAEPYKGFHTLLHALMLMNGAPTLILIAALVDPRDEYVRHLRALIDCVPSRVCLATNFDVRMPRVLQQSQALLAVIVPSLVEPFGLIAAEVLTNPYCKAPLICSRAGGLAEQVMDEETGFLFTPGDVANLVGVLSRAKGMSEEERRRMKDGGLAQRHRFDLMKNVESFLRYVGQLPRLDP